MGKTVGIFSAHVNGLKPWDPDSIESGITGSEEAVIYASQKLAKRGYRVLVYNTPPQKSIHSKAEANPRFLNYESYQAPLDIAIICRNPHLGQYIRPHAKKLYLWPHDTWNFMVPEAEVRQYDGVFWLSEWQRKQWISVNPSFSKFEEIFGNGINPEQFSPVSERENPYSCIYGSNYGRGLEILASIWPAVKEAFPRASLDVYYGWQHWGQLSAEKEAELRKKISALKSLNVQEHGLVSHKELTDAYARTSFWTYPCILPETFCITAIKAQLAGAVPVILEGSALSETVRHGYSCSQRSEYLALLLDALKQAETISLQDRSKMGEFILNEFTWEKMMGRWDRLFC